MSFDIDVIFSEEHRGVRRRGILRDFFNAFADACRNTEPAMREIGDALVESTRKRFDTETDPQGNRWAPNSPVTLAKKSGTKILTDSGALKASIRAALYGSGKGVSVGSSLPYTAMMQFGGTKARFPHLWGDIPARPFLGRSAEDQETIREIMRKHLGLA